MARLQVAEARLGAVCMVARVRPLVTALLPASVTRSRESELGPATPCLGQSTPWSGGHIIVDRGKLTLDKSLNAN